MSKARTLAGVVSTGAVLADGVVDASEIGSLTLPTGGDIVGTTAVQTLTNKTITYADNTLTGVVGTTATQTLTNKTIDIANNTLTGVQPTLVSGTSIKTVNSTSLLGSGDVAVQPTLVSGTNIKTVGGQSVLGSGDLVVGGGSWVFLSSVTASSSATVDIESTIDSTYDAYAIIATNVAPDNANPNFLARLKLGGNYSTAASYCYTTNNSNSTTTANTIVSVNVAGNTSIQLMPSVARDAEVNGAGLNFTMILQNPASATTLKSLYVQGVGIRQVTSAQAASMSVSAIHRGTFDALTGVRFFFSAGTVVRGTFRLYGIKNS